MLPLLLLLSLPHSHLSLEITQVSQEGHLVVRDGDPAVLSCETDTQEDMECTWVLPSGVQCDLNVDKRQCRSDPNVVFNGTANLCQIRINSVDEAHNGEWTCSVRAGGNHAEAKVMVTLGRKAEVEWLGGDLETGFTVHLKHQEPKLFGCQAMYSRPAGSFIFHFGEDYRLPDNIINPDTELTTSKDDEGLWNVSQSVTLIPDLEMDGQELFCSFLQLDGTGREVFVTQQSLDLAVHALIMEPEAKTQWIASSGDDVTVSYGFTSLPKPLPSDVIWVINIEGNEHEISLLEADPVEVAHYIAYPIEKVSQNEYEVRLTMTNITKEENDNSHFLRVKNKLSSSNTIDAEVQFMVLVDQAPLEPESTQLVVIIVIIVIILLVAIIIAVMLVVYAKKNNIWCYASSTTPYIKEDITERKEPLMKHHPYGRPSAV